MNDHARPPSEITVVRHQIDDMATQFHAALPAHIPVERFARVVMTAIQNNGDLLACNRRSLFNAAMKAAQDGLLPDGREGAMVPYKGHVTWMPMVGGLRKKVRNSGEIATWDVHAVFEGDAFEYELGDEPFIRHKPALTGRGKLIAVYSIATLKTGEKSRDVMSVEDVEKIRAKSLAKHGPWNDPVFYPEMAKKTVARRHSKLLPMSSDLDDLIRRDDELYDMKGAREEASASAPKTLAGRLDQLADFSGGGGDAETIDADTGEIVDASTGSAQGEPTARETAPPVPPKSKSAPSVSAASDGGQPPVQPSPDETPPSGGGDPIAEARRAGAEARAKGMSRKACPPAFRKEGNEEFMAAWVAGWETGEAEREPGEEG